MFRKLFAWMNKYERHLSALAMVAGFVVDQIFFGRIDILRTQALFAGYVALCVLSIAWLHWLERRAEEGRGRPRWRPILPFITQFTLGGFWSGFVFFYGQAAVLGVSWPFLALLVVILIGNEVLKKYHDRLVFTNLLFFFALYSYAIFELPLATHAIGMREFLLAGLAAVIFFALFTLLLYAIDRKRRRAARRPIVIGAFMILLAMNVFYFSGILPPLPLSLKQGGIYHSVVHEAPLYTALAEPEAWQVRLGLADPTIHLSLPAPLYTYSAVFAPIALSTEITHRWEWYDEAQKQWITEAAVSYPIQGGRDGGYLGYSYKLIAAPGRWRVDIETVDGRVIGRLGFDVVNASSSPALESVVLN